MTLHVPYSGKHSREKKNSLMLWFESHEILDVPLACMIGIALLACQAFPAKK